MYFTLHYNLFEHRNRTLTLYVAMANLRFAIATICSKIYGVSVLGPVTNVNLQGLKLKIIHGYTTDQCRYNQ